MRQKKKKQPTISTIDNADLMIADIPVRISLIHQAKTIFEYDEVIDINFTTDTPEGRRNGVKALSLKHGKGLSTEDALFSMANDEFMENEKYIASKLKFPNLKGLEGPNELQFSIKRNGEIKYRKHVR